MNSIKLDFLFNEKDTKQNVINTLSDYFCINNKKALKECLDSMDQNRLGEDDVLTLINEFRLNLRKSLYDEIQIKCKHGTTTIDEFRFLKKFGFISLNKLLEIKSPIRKFLIKNKIEIDIKNKILSYKRKKYRILNSEEICNKCIYDEIDCHNEFSNLNCEYREDLYRLYLKLYKDKGATEVFISTANEDIYDYSCIRYYPEILHTFDNLLVYFDRKRVLTKKWVKKTKRTFYILEFYTDANNFEYIPTKLLYEGYWSIASILEYFDYDECDFDEDRIDKVFFINLFVLHQLIYNYYGMRVREYGCLLPEIVIPWENISFDKIIKI